MKEWEKQINDLRVTEKIGRAALFDNIQALDARVVELEKRVVNLRNVIDIQAAQIEMCENLNKQVAKLMHIQQELNESFGKGLVK
jgi:hypothetical protein